SGWACRNGVGPNSFGRGGGGDRRVRISRTSQARYFPPGRKDTSSSTVDSVLIVVISGPLPFSVYSAARASRTGALTSGAYQTAARSVVRVRQNSSSASC